MDMLIGNLFQPPNLFTGFPVEMELSLYMDAVIAGWEHHQRGVST